MITLHDGKIKDVARHHFASQYHTKKGSTCSCLPI